ncbi:MAG: hypothetical protein LIP08_08390 [Bacteroides sp.]|nr:hypothetical protein [Bacteroides sp.]
MKKMDTRLQEAAHRWFRHAWPEYTEHIARTGQQPIRQVEAPAGLTQEHYHQGRPDFVLECPNRFYHFLAVELKLPFGTRPQGQAAWRQVVERQQGKYSSCHTLADFIRAINQYMDER